MKPEIKYSFGDAVYGIICEEAGYGVLRCDFCKGGRVVGLNKQLMPCPKCSGTRKFYVSGNDNKWRVIRKPLIVSRIILENDDEASVFYEDYYGETVVGERDAFLTIEEAEEECKRRNRDGYQDKV